MDTDIKRPYIKPAFYAHYLPIIQEKAREMGYNILLHGSMNRDLDLVAVPWTNDPEEEVELIHAIDVLINGDGGQSGSDYMYSGLPGGRNSYIINILRMNEDNGYEDAQYYLDISVTPFVAPMAKRSIIEQFGQQLNNWTPPEKTKPLFLISPGMFELIGSDRIREYEEQNAVEIRAYKELT